MCIRVRKRVRACGSCKIEMYEYHKKLLETSTAKYLFLLVIALVFPLCTDNVAIAAATAATTATATAGIAPLSPCSRPKKLVSRFNFHPLLVLFKEFKCVLWA